MKRKRAAAPAPTDSRFEELREKWAPQWCVWRSRGDNGEPISWCATRRDPSRTLVEPTADALETALTRDTGEWAFHD